MKSEIVHLAKQGNAKAIATIINAKLKPKNIQAQVAIQTNCLQVILVSAAIAQQQKIVLPIYKFLNKLINPSIREIKFYGQQLDNGFIVWQQAFNKGESEEVSESHSTDILNRIAVALEVIAKNSNYPSQNFTYQETSYPEKSSIQTNPKLVISKENNEPLKTFLNSKGITIKSLPSLEEANQYLDRIALFMGDRYESIQKIYQRIKKNLSTSSSFKLDLKTYSQAEISNICQLCNSLHQVAFLEEYTYQKSPKYQLYAKPNRSSNAINFLSGHWLEIYIKEKIIQILNDCENSAIRYSYLINPKIQLPNGDDFELDILFSINENIFWFEAKTGEYQKHIEKYAKISKIMDLDKEQSFMILTDINDSTTDTLSKLYNLTVVNVENFSDVFSQVLTTNFL